MEEGLSAADISFLAHARQCMQDLRIAEEGGYNPPDGDPRKCEPANKDAKKGGFEYRVEHGETTPFERCDDIQCHVREACTAAVLEELSK